jgi:hypothetical protein
MPLLPQKHPKKEDTHVLCGFPGGFGWEGLWILRMHLKNSLKKPKKTIPKFESWWPRRPALYAAKIQRAFRGFRPKAV